MLNSLYEKAIAKRGFIHDIESETDIESLLEGRWFDRDIGERWKFQQKEISNN